MLIAAPVGPRNALQLHRFHLAGGEHMRPRAKIREIPLLVKRNDGILRKPVDELHLVRLRFFRKEPQRLRPADLLSDEGQILLDDALHFLLHIFQVLVGELSIHLNVIVKAVLDGRADGELNVLIGIEVLQGLRHDVGRRVAQGQPPPLVLKGQKFHRSVLRQGSDQPHDLAVHLRRQNLLRQAVAHGLDEI